MAGSSQPAGSVSVEVVADLTKLDAGLRDASARSKAAGTQIAGDLSKVEGAAKGASAATEKLAGAEDRAARAGQGLAASQDRVGQSTARAATLAERMAAQWSRATAAASEQQRALSLAAAANDNAAGAFGRMGASAVGALGILLRFGAVGAVMATATAGIAALTVAVGLLVGLIPSIIRVGAEMQTLERGFAAAAGSAQQGQREFNFISETADRLGLSLGESAKQYLGFLAASRGTALQGKDTRDIFVAITTAMGALGKNTEETKRALIAVQQMMSKGKVSAEEMTGQLGEALPGALSVSAKAMGMTQQALLKLMGDGKLFASDLLPKLAKELQATYGDAAAKAANGFRASMNRLSNAWIETRDLVYRSGFGEAFDRLVAGFSGTIINFLRENRDLAVGFGNALASVTDTIRSFGGSAVDAFYGVLDGARAVLTIFRELDAAAGAVLPSISGALSGVGEVILSAFSGLPGAMSDVLSAVLEADKAILNGVIGALVTAYEASVAAWAALPAALGQIGAAAANALIAALEGAVNFAVSGLNKLIAGANAVGGALPEAIGFKKIAEVSEVSFGRVTAASAGAATKLKADLGDIAKSAMSRDYLGEAGGALSKRYNDLTTGYRKAREESRALATAQKDTENAARGAATSMDDAGKKGGNAAKEAAKAAKEAAAEFEKLKSAAEDAFKKLFPEDALRKKGEELQGLLDKYRDKLAAIDPRYVTAIETQIKLNLDGKELEGVKSKADDLSKDMSRAFSGVFDEMFSAGNKGFNGLLSSFTRSLSRVGSRALETTFLTPLLSGKEGGASGGIGGMLDGFGKLFDTGGIEKAVNKGSQGGIFDAFSTWLKPAQGADGKAAGGFATSKLGSGLMSAGVGASIGYQSQSPLMGAIGGAASGFAMGGPVGGLIGGAAGLLGGIFGKSQAKKEAEKKIKEQLEAYKEAYRQAQPEIEKLRATFRGESIGNVGGTIDAAFQQAYQANVTASKAGDQATADRIMVEFVQYAERLRFQFIYAFEGTLSEVARGFGTSGPFAQANAAVATLGESLKAFVADAQKLPEAESNGARARAAAQQSALAALDPPKALSDTQARLAAIQGTAAGLGRVLQDLGMSADEAADAIRDRTVQAMDALRASFSADLGAKINEAAGKSYLNDVADLVKERDALMADAQAIGASTAQVSQYFGLAAQRIVDDSELTGDAFAALVAQFPALRGQVVEFSQALDTAAAKAAAAARALGYQNRLFAAENDTSTIAGQLAAYDRQAQQEREQEIKEGGQALADLEAAQFAERLKIVRDYQKQAADAERQRMEAATQAFNTFARGIKEYLDGLRAGPSSNLSPAERLAAARGQFDAQLQAARGGDRDALNGITSYASTLLDASKGYNASSPAYQADLQRVMDLLASLPKQVSAEQFIVDAINSTSTALLAGVQANSPIAIAQALNGNFDRLDTSLDGLLSPEEFVAGLGPLATKAEQEAAKELFRQIDANGDGMLDKLEVIRFQLKAAIEANNPAAVATALNANFGKLDTSVNGLLDYGEFLAGVGPLATKAEQQAAKAVFDAIDTNGDGQISRLEAVNASVYGTTMAVEGNSGHIYNAAVQAYQHAETVRSAVAANSPSLVAAALDASFSRLDTSVNGLLDYGEVVAALGPMATRAEQEAARRIFDQIDANGDGQLDKLELVRARTAGVEQQTGAAIPIQQDSAATLRAINEVSSLQRSQLEALNNQFAYSPFNAPNGIRLDNNLVTALNKIVFNTANTVIGQRAGASYTFARGGYVAGPGTGTSDSIDAKLSNGEFVVTAEATRRYGRATLDAMNDNRLSAPMMPVPVAVGGESNAALLAELRALRAQVASLERELRANTDVADQGHQLTVEAVKRNTSAVQEGNATASRQSLARKPKAA
ncbi:tape measure protein [Methylorubrum extorquens]|uniref:tape measure protein n=1 Tax=Methylorubrum extorquens TaxID=408 RepID=UPI003F5F6806